MRAPVRQWNTVIIIVLLLAIVAAGLYLGYRWPHATATGVLIALIAIWMVAERLTGRWW